MNIKKLKSDKGISMVDIIGAIIILNLFIGVIGTLYYQILLNSNLIRSNATAVYYTVKIAEDIDRMAYEDVTNNLNTNINNKYEINEHYTASISVENYNKNDSSKKDIIKIVTIKIQYDYLDTSNEYKISKLKIKEI